MSAKPDDLAAFGMRRRSRTTPEAPPGVTPPPPDLAARPGDLIGAPEPPPPDPAAPRRQGLGAARPGDLGTSRPGDLGTSRPTNLADAPPPSKAAGDPAPAFLTEDTQTLPVVAAPVPAEALRPAKTLVPRRKPPAPSVAARAVIVYEMPPRRPWRLAAFTAVIVALTVGVVLGQAVAWQPTSRTAATAEAGVVPSTPVAEPARPGPGQQVTAPLGSIRKRLLEVTGSAAVVRIHSADLGPALFHAAALDSSAVPSWTDTGTGTRLELVGTGTPGTPGLDVQLNSRVSWTIRVTGGAAEQDVDLRAGGLAGLTLPGGSLMVLRLPKPKGTVPIAISGAVGRVSVATATAVPVRLRLANGAGVVTVDGAKQGTVRTPPGWKTAKNRYDLSASGTVASVAVTHR